MSHVRLTHPSRPTLEFYRAQNDDISRSAVLNIANELAVDRTPLVHTETREIERTIRGSVSAPLRARNDGSTNDWQQSLANYADLLEAHVNEYQGIPGYTLEDDQLDISKTATLESIEWSLSPGQLYELNFEATVIVGRGTFESDSIGGRNPTVDSSMDVMLRVDGEDLPGFRDYRMNRSIGIEPRAVFDRDSAENNDLLINEGPQQTVVFEGEHTGSLAQRRAADAALESLLATKNNVTLETAFPGYSLDGFVTAYNSTLENQRGGNSHRYRFEFVEGERA